MEAQEIIKGNFYSKENIESNGFKYVNESQFYIFYHKDGLLYVFDAKKENENENHKILAILDNWN